MVFSTARIRTQPPASSPDRFNRTRFLLDAFYTLYCPERMSEIDELVEEVQSGEVTLDGAAARLCQLHSSDGVNSSDWMGVKPRALLKFRFDRFYSEYDPEGMEKIPALVDHIAGGKYPATVVLNKMCTKYASAGAKIVDWVDDYPMALRDKLGPKPIDENKSHVTGDVITAIIDGKEYTGKITSIALDGSFDVSFTGRFT